MANIRDWKGLVRLVGGASTLLLAATACSGAAPVASEDPRPVVLATFTVLADMADTVAGDTLRVESITRPGAPIHDYEPTPSDLTRGHDADLILANGLGLDAWLTRFTANTDAPSVTVSDGAATVPIAGGAYVGQANPHAWMSPDNAAVYIANIRDAFTELDPANAETYAANAATYTDRVAETGARLRSELADLPDRHRALVTCEGAFSYLARDAGLEERYLWPVNAETQATPQRTAEVVEFVRSRELPAVFCESTVNDGVQRRVAEETTAAMGAPLYVDSLSGEEGPVPSYLDLLRYDITAITTGLKGARGG